LASDVISLLSDLVKIPSICGEEKAIANFIADWLKSHHIQAETLDARPNRPNVIARIKSQNPGPRILLNGHMDTVEVGNGWTHDPFGAKVEGGKMYGRGTEDMKSGLAAILWATAACKEEGLPKRGELLVAAVVDEEALDWGTFALVQEGLTKGLDFAMISECTDLKVVTAHRGRATFVVDVHGKAAHSQWPDHGVNAIEQAARLIAAFPNIAGPTHPKLGRSTINTLRIEGGQEDVMLVPDKCRVLIDRCLVPSYTSAAALEDLKHLISTVGIDADARLSSRETPFCEPFEIPENDPTVQRIVNIAAKVLGKAPEIDFHAGPCDSCILVNQGKVPTIEFGPIGSGPHEPDEYVYVDSVRKTAEVYHEIITTFLS
jgi:succinyl-diaminopimelate desuccinylase